MGLIISLLLLFGVEKLIDTLTENGKSADEKFIDCWNDLV